MAMLEDDEDLVANVDSITLMPPINACGSITDNDSGEEDHVSVNNLPGSQLQASAEINFTDRGTFSSSDSEDNISLAELAKKYKRKIRPTKKKKTYQWVKEDLTPNTPEIFDNDVADEIKPPLEWFSDFFDDELFTLLTVETNRYASQKNNHLEVVEREVRAFVGILLLSGYVPVPRRRMFWERERDANNVLVTEALSRDKFEYIMSNFHLADNLNLDHDDKFAKVRPLFKYLNKKFLEKGILTPMHSVDEAMVPYFGRHSCKQFIHGKPIRYGYKLWVGTSNNGYIYWFEPYQGASTNISKTYCDLGVGASVVLEYADALRSRWTNEKFHLFFDNFFTSIPLIEKLSEKGFLATGTARENRIQGVDLQDSKVMKREKRGTYDYRKISDQDIITVKWHDNNLVTLCSNSVGVEPIQSVTRYSQKEKKNIQVGLQKILNNTNYKI